MTMFKPRVFVTQDVPKLNLLPAKQFGELVVMCPPGDMSRDLGRTILRFNYEMKDIRDIDFLLPIGDPLLIGISIAIALKHRKPLKVLRWDRQEKQYDVITIKEI